MTIFTRGIELSTSITNVFILIVSIIGYLLIKKDKLWNIFFLLMIFDSFLGVIVHGIVMSDKINTILWIILSILFTITVNTLLCIFTKLNKKYILYLSLLLSIILLVQMKLNMNYLLTFTIYVILVVIISIYFIIKNNLEEKFYLLLGFIILIIGVILMLCKAKIGIINHNGICHLFLTITLLLFIIGIRKRSH